MAPYVIWFNALGMGDVPEVGGKNASLGEMTCQLGRLSIRVPEGFATTAQAYRHFLEEDNLGERISQRLRHLDIRDVDTLAKTGAEIRHWMESASLPADLEQAIRQAYGELEGRGGASVPVAVRSSATAEDLPDASFAGQQETYLNMRGIDAVLDAVRKVFASLYNDRAIAYREHHGFQHDQVALSAGIQRMVRSDLAASGVMFTIDTESGFPNVVLITSTYGLGEALVQGAVNPDEFYVDKRKLAEGKNAVLSRKLGSKALRIIYADQGGGIQTVPVPAQEAAHFSIDDTDVQELARQACRIEQHYGRPMDIEWAKDGVDGLLYIVQARPETVKSRANAQVVERYLLEKTGKVLIAGRAIGQKIGQGKVRVVRRLQEMNKVRQGDVLVADMTDPDWEPVMKLASAIVTNRGGRTCHAAIIARELGVPAVVGCGQATEALRDDMQVTVSCAEGDTGLIYEGLLPITVRKAQLDAMPTVPVKIMMNVGNPERAFDFASLPNEGVGLCRLEFMISRMIGIHPKAALQPEKEEPAIQAQIKERAAGYASPAAFYTAKLAEGIATLASAFYPKPVIVRLSDFKSNEYANLIGGASHEPHEENPMLGYRGASRYLSEDFRPCFALECQAMRQVREEMGFENVWVMVPFVRTVDEAQAVCTVLAEHGLKRGQHGLKLIMMCEVPSNALLAEAFLEHFDGFSIGSNDLTQLTLGLDRDSGLVASLFDERNPAVKVLLERAITACRKAGRYVGICGQGPSDHPDLAQWLMEQGIASLSLNPDTVVETWLALSKQH